MRPELRIEYLRRALYEICEKCGGLVAPGEIINFEVEDTRVQKIARIRARASAALLDDEKRLHS